MRRTAHPCSQCCICTMRSKQGNLAIRLLHLGEGPESWYGATHARDGRPRLACAEDFGVGPAGGCRELCDSDLSRHQGAFSPAGRVGCLLVYLRTCAGRLDLCNLDVGCFGPRGLLVLYCISLLSASNSLQVTVFRPHFSFAYYRLIFASTSSLLVEVSGWAFTSTYHHSFNGAFLAYLRSHTIPHHYLLVS